MNRTDRLLAMVLELQHAKHRRAEDLAATFEVSKRTIYRDVQALCEAGIPVVAMPGHGYSLVEGYFLPPLNTTVDEALILLLGASVMSKHFDQQYQKAAYTAMQKIETVMSDSLLEEVNYLRQNIGFVSFRNWGTEQKREQLRQLRRAIITKQVIGLAYTRLSTSKGANVTTRRDVEPYSLAKLSDDWYLLAYCRLRKSARMFRLSRMDEVELKLESFGRRSKDEVHWPSLHESRDLTIQVLFPSDIARWVLESLPYFVTSTKPIEEGLFVTLHVRSEQEVMHWLLSWGSKLRVISPESIKNKMKQELEENLKQYKKN